VSTIKITVQFQTDSTVDVDDIIKQVNSVLKNKSSKWKIILESSQIEINHVLNLKLCERLFNDKELFYKKLKGVDANITVITDTLHEHFVITKLTVEHGGTTFTF
jgi:hypothetical protein